MTAMIILMIMIFSQDGGSTLFIHEVTHTHADCVCEPIIFPEQ